MRRSPVCCQVLVSKTLGGAERVALAIHDYQLSRRPGGSRLLVPSGGPLLRHLGDRRADVRQYDLDGLLKGSRVAGARAAAGVWASATAWRRSALLHVHSPAVLGALRPAAWAMRSVRVLHLHLDYSDDELRWAFRVRPDLVILCADFMRPAVTRVMEETACGAVPVITIRNAVDTETFGPGNRVEEKRRIGIDPSRPVVLVAANLSPHKGQETAIRALHALSANRLVSRPVLLLAGEERGGGDYTGTLHSLVAEYGLTADVQFLGLRPDVARLLKAADILLLPSTKEGLPLSILEAQASRTVVLAAPTAGVPEVVCDGQTGFLVDANDSQGYALRLQRLIEHPEDARRVADTAAAQVAAHHTYPAYFESIEEAYRAASVSTVAAR